MLKICQRLQKYNGTAYKYSLEPFFNYNLYTDDAFDNGLEDSCTTSN